MTLLLPLPNRRASSSMMWCLLGSGKRSLTTSRHGFIYIDTGGQSTTWNTNCTLLPLPSLYACNTML